ncbi:MAG TPA: hypothetical protein DD618_00495 [Acholeplasmatales bacterium]|nr:hypothetical protein [Acholeplasmatales bacterium]
MKKFSLLLGMGMLMLSAGLFGCTIGSSDAYAADAYVVLDINPSVEIFTDEDGLVSQVNALNDDAEALLVDTDYVGKTVEETVEAIVTLATELGYIDFDAENAIIVTAVGANDADTEKLENKIRDRIKAYTDKQQIHMDIIQARTQASAEMAAKAEELGVSIGKLKLMTMAMQFDETLTLEAGAGMAVRELNGIVSGHRQEMKDFVTEGLKGEYFAFRQEARQVYSVSRIGFINDAMILAEDSVFAPVIGESATTAAEIRALYQEYLDAVNAIVIPEQAEIDALQAEVLAELNADETFNGLLAQRVVRISEMVALRIQLAAAHNHETQAEGLRTQLQTKWQEVKTLTEQIRAYKAQYVTDFETEHPSYRFTITFEGEAFGVQVQFDWMNEFRLVREEYAIKFADISIDLEALEELFEEQIASQLSELRNQYAADLGALKAEFKGECDAMREEFRNAKEETRNMWGK